MLIAATNWSAVGAIVGGAGFAITVGGFIGRAASRSLHARSTRLDADRLRHEDEKLMRQAIVGTPATDFTPRQPGLQEITRDLQKGHIELQAGQTQLVEAYDRLQKDILEHRRDDLAIAEQFHEHLRDIAIHQQKSEA